MRSPSRSFLSVILAAAPAVRYPGLRRWRWRWRGRFGSMADLHGQDGGQDEVGQREGDGGAEVDRIPCSWAPMIVSPSVAKKTETRPVVVPIPVLPPPSSRPGSRPRTPATMTMTIVVTITHGPNIDTI